MDKVRYVSLLFLMAALLFSFSQRSASCGEVQQRSGPYTASLVSMEWVGFPLGTVMEVGAKKRMMQRDLVMLQFVVKVDNNSDTDKEFPFLFFLHNAKGKELASLDRYSEEYKKWYGGISFIIPAASSKTLYLQGMLLPLKELQAEDSMEVVHTSLKWNWDVIDLPKHAEFYLADKRSKIFSCEVTDQKWDSLPAGTKIMRNDTPAFVKSNLAGLEVSVRITNISDSEQLLKLPKIILVDRFYEPIKLLHPKLDSNGEPDLPDGFGQSGIQLQPNASVSIELRSAMKGYDKLKDREPFHLEEPEHRWYIPVGELPPWDKLQ